MTEEKKRELEFPSTKDDATLKDTDKERHFEVLTGKAAEDFMNKLLKQHEEEVNKDPHYYAKFGYKWNNDTTKYRWEDDMNEISGFGSHYEECCRFMVTKGLEFVDDLKAVHPDSEDPKISTYRNIYGIVNDENKTAEHLSEYLCKATEDYFGKSFGPSGAQIQAVMTSISWILYHSWAEYVTKMKEPRPRDIAK